jgi:hypothetical protein
MHASLGARVFREYLLSCRMGRFADDSIIGDCVDRGSHLSAFAGSRKADNLFDCERYPVQAMDSIQTTVSMDFAP